MPFDTPFVDTVWDDCDEHWIRKGVGVVAGTMEDYRGPLPDGALQPLVGSQQDWQEGLDYDTWINGGYTNPNGCWQAGLREKTVMAVEVSSAEPSVEEGLEASGSGLVVYGANIGGVEVGGTYSLEYGSQVAGVEAGGYAALNSPLEFTGGTEAGGAGLVGGTVAYDGLAGLEAGGSGAVLAEAVYGFLAGLEAGGSGAVAESAALAMIAALEAGGSGLLAANVALLMGGGVAVSGDGMNTVVAPALGIGGTEAGGSGLVGNVHQYPMAGGAEAGGTFALFWNPLMRGELLDRNFVRTAEATSSTSDIALTTADECTFTLDATGPVLVFFSYQATNTGLVSVTSSLYLDATLQGSSAQALQIYTAGQYITGVISFPITSVAAGSHTWTIKHKVPSGTGTWRFRSLVIVRG